MSRTAFLNKLRAAALALAALAGGAGAHRPWLLPSAAVVDGAKPVVSVDAAMAEDLFVFDGFTLPLDELTVVAPDGQVGAGEARTASRRRTSFDVPLAQKGTYRLSGFSEQVMASWKEGDETKRWRGAVAAAASAVPAQAAELRVSRSRTRVETFVTNDTASAVAPLPADAPGLALQPLGSPTDLSAGDTTRFRLLLDGRPLAGADLTLIRGDNRYRYKLGEIALKTDADGAFAVTWPEPGRWWLGASRGGRGEGGAPPALRDAYSATFEVLPR